MMSLVTQPFDLSLSMTALLSRFPPWERPARCRARAHELLAVGQLGGSIHVRPWCLLAGAVLSCSYPFGTT